MDCCALAVFYRFRRRSASDRGVGLEELRVKNRFLERNSTFGYRDVLVNMRVDGGFIVDAQRLMRRFYKALRALRPEDVAALVVSKNFHHVDEKGKGDHPNK